VQTSYDMSDQKQKPKEKVSTDFVGTENPIYSDTNTATLEEGIPPEKEKVSTDFVDAGNLIGSDTNISTFEEEISKLKDKTNQQGIDIKESKNQYIQIFGVFASIITLVGFNTVSAQKDIISIIIGNLFLGFFLIGFVWLLYLVPKLLEQQGYINYVNTLFSDLMKNLLTFLKFILRGFSIILAVIFGISVAAFCKDDFNIGLCNLYTLGEIKIQGRIYCSVKTESLKPQTQFINNQNLK
jgi:hypothetical protein